MYYVCTIKDKSTGSSRSKHVAHFYFVCRSSPPFRSPPGVQIFGLLATALVTDVIQLATGYPTPFFLTVCQPNYTAPGVSCQRNSYITRDICSGRDQHAILAAR